MIHTYCRTATENSGIWRGPEALTDPTTKILWIDLENPTEEEERLVFEKVVPVHLLTREDITRLRRFPDQAPHLPKIEEFHDYLFVLVNPLHPGTHDHIRQPRPERLENSPLTQLSAVLTRDLLVTHHVLPLTAVTETREALGRGAIQPERGPDYLFHLILDKVVDFYAPVLACLEDHLDEIETAVFARPTPKLFHRILTFKQIVSGLRKSLQIEREVVIRLSRAEFTLIDEREAIYYRNVLDHLTRFIEGIEMTREQVHDLMEMHLASQSNRMNEIMKALTIISTVTLPMTLIAGIYGMNYTLVPTNETGGFWFALGMMLFAGGVPLAFFRWRKWL